MEVVAKEVTGWSRVLDAARFTARKAMLDKEPSDRFKKTILLAEHSPIRERVFDIIIKDLPFCNMGHLVRHHEGVEKYVETSRENRTGVPRSQRSQTEPVDVKMTINAQALINISRKRMCSCADPVTIKAWKMVIDAVKELDPVMASVCVRECVYRGFCPEFEYCGYAGTKSFFKELANYRSRLFPGHVSKLGNKELLYSLEVGESTKVDMTEQQAKVLRSYASALKRQSGAEWTIIFTAPDVYTVKRLV